MDCPTRRHRTLTTAALWVATVLLASGLASAGLVSHWTFDDGGGQTATDSTTAHDGTLGGNPAAGTNDPAWTTAGKLGSALVFDGGDHVDTGASILPATGNFTAMGWVKTGTDHDGTMMGQGPSTASRLILYGTRDSSGDIARLYLGDQVVVSTTKTNDDQWHHVALSREGTTFRIFVDGVNEGTGSSGTAVPTGGASDNTMLGRADNATNFGFRGTLDDMAIWDETLSISEVGAVHALGNSPTFGYNVSQVQQLLDIHDAGTGTVRIGDHYWAYQAGLNTYEQPLGKLSQAGDAYVLPLSSAGTGLVAHDLIGHWAFDDGSGTTPDDSTGASDGSFGGTPTWTTGKLDGALAFDGADWVNTNSIVLPDTDDFTISGWVQTSTSHDGAMVGQGPSADPRLILYGTRTSSGDIARLYLHGQVVVSTTKTNDGEWHQVTLSRTGNTFKIYVDGEHEGTGSTTVAVPIDDPATDKTMIGAADNSGGFRFQGKIDDVAIWNRALSDTEVKASHGLANTAGIQYNASETQRLFDLFQAGSGSASIENHAWHPASGLAGAPGDVVDQGGGTYAVVLDASGNGVASWTGLIGHWSFDDATGQTATDPAGGNHGRLGRTTGADAGDPTWTTGKLGGALSFDGSDYVDTEAIVLPGSSDFTAMGWVKTTISQDGAIFGQGRAVGSDLNRLIFYGTRTQNDAGTKFNIARVYLGGQMLVSDTSTNDDEWHHVALTRTGDTWRLYIDGVEEDSTVTSRTIPDSDVLTDCTILGMAENGTAYGYRGLIDDMGIWNIALSGPEVMAISSLAAEGFFGYDLGQVQQLFDLHAGGTGALDLGAWTWEAASGLSTDLGIPTRIGDDVFLRLDGNGGGVKTFIPEPATLLLLAAGLPTLVRRRKRRA